jgi:hypothetical protein
MMDCRVKPGNDGGNSLANFSSGPICLKIS